MILNNYSVLYVEDSKLLREFMKKLLSNHVKSIVTANDGQDGLDAFQKHKPDIVITDINMPLVSGIEMSRIIKLKYPLTPIVLLTQFDNIDYLKNAIEIGVDAFISKPIEELALLRHLEMIAKKLQDSHDAKLLKELQIRDEKLTLLLKLIQKIGHHWRQPLSVIMSIATGHKIKKMHNLPLSPEDEIRNLDKISDQVEKLSAVLLTIQNIDLARTSLEEIENLVEISRPLYDPSEENKTDTK